MKKDWRTMIIEYEGAPTDDYFDVLHDVITEAFAVQGLKVDGITDSPYMGVDE